jgi:hypothetical protein
MDKVCPCASSVLPSRFDFHKCSQLFIRTHNETLSVVAMCVCNPNCRSLRFQKRSELFVGIYTTSCRPEGKSDSSVTFRGLRT